MITEENFIDFKCPHCGNMISFPYDSVGMAEECPSCMADLIVPKAANAEGRKLPLPITTPRLMLRRFAMNDWKDFMGLVSDEQFYQNTEGLPGTEEEQVLHWLESDSVIKLTTPDQMFRLAIELQESGKLIGYLGLRFSDRLQATLRVNLHRNYHRKGFALEAVDALLGFCFEGIKLHRVTACCDSTNAAACRLFENVGMRREGEFVKDRFVLGEWMSSVWYAALDEEYREAGDKPAEGSPA
jgi:[ribosomal protein S5]-alanine N-acetyltransferase